MSIYIEKEKAGIFKNISRNVKTLFEAFIYNNVCPVTYGDSRAKKVTGFCSPAECVVRHNESIHAFFFSFLLRGPLRPGNLLHFHGRCTMFLSFLSTPFVNNASPYITSQFHLCHAAERNLYRVADRGFAYRHMHSAPSLRINSHSPQYLGVLQSRKIYSTNSDSLR